MHLGPVWRAKLDSGRDTLHIGERETYIAVHAMKTARLFSAVLLSLSLAACDDGTAAARPDVGGSAGKADDAQGSAVEPEVQAQHLQAVGTCEVAANRERETTSALRFEQRQDIEVARATCLSTANDATRSPMAVTLERTAPELALGVGDTFTAWRTAHANFCALLIDGHALALDKSIIAVEAGCAAESELRLAEALETIADLGGTRAVLPDASSLYPDCYANFTAALEGGANDGPEPDGPADDSAGDVPDVDTGAAPADDSLASVEADAYAGLADCIEADLERSWEALGNAILQSFPGRDPSRVADEIEKEYIAIQDAVDDVCITLGHAAPDDALVAVEQCRAGAAIWRHEVIGYVIPEAGPQPTDEAPQGE